MIMIVGFRWSSDDSFTALKQPLKIHVRVYGWKWKSASYQHNYIALIFRLCLCFEVWLLAKILWHFTVAAGKTSPKSVLLVGTGFSMRFNWFLGFHSLSWSAGLIIMGLKLRRHLCGYCSYCISSNKNFLSTTSQILGFLWVWGLGNKPSCQALVAFYRCNCFTVRPKWGFHPSIFCSYPVLDRRASSLSRDARTCDMNVITLSSTCPWNLPWSTSCSVPIQAPHYFNPQPALLSVKQMLLMLTFRLSWGVTKPGLYRLAVVRSGIVTYQHICWDGVKIGTFLCSKHINVVWLRTKGLVPV